MPSTYTLNNGIELIGTGEQSGTWGDTTNTNLDLLDAALDGQVTITLGAAGSSGSPNALPITDGTASNGRNRMVVFADGADLGATAYVQLTPNDAEKIIYIRNSLSGSRSVILFQGTYNASNDYEVPAGTTAIVYFDGAGAGAVAANVFNNAYFDGLRLGSVSVTAILDEDNMASDSATALATQQSIKAYVDAQVGTVDTLAEILAIGNTTGGTDLAVSTGDDITFADSSKAIFGAGSDLQIYHDGSQSFVQENGTGQLVLDTQNGARVKLTSNNGTENMVVANKDGDVELYYDNALKLATTATGIDVTGTVTATGTSVFASLDISGDIDVDGTTNLDVVDIDGATQIDATVTVGVDDTGYDVKFFGATAGAYMLWDESADDLILGGAAGLSVNSTALVTGVLTTTAATVHTGGITMPDNAKATFGDKAGGDLQIYHNANNSYIRDVGTGDLIIASDGTGVSIDKGTSEHMATFDIDGAVTLYHDALPKLATTATGIDVTGDITLGDTNPTITFNDSSIVSLSHTVSSASDNLRLTVDVNGVDAGSRVEIFDGSTEVARFSSGAVLVTGTVTADGLSVDGGTIKLDGNYPVGTGNVALGDAAGAAITSGGRNTLIGGSAGDALTVGERNVVIGTDALSADTQGSRSVAIGQAALANQNFTSATDNYNVAVGFQAGVNVSTGITNTMIGGFALQANTTASNNTAVGYQAGYSNTTGTANTFVGSLAGDAQTTAANSTAVGYAALGANTTGSNNTAIGKEALDANTTGSENVGVGVGALGGNTTAANNVAVGVNALLANTTGSENTAVGKGALTANTTASYNVAVGEGAGVAITTGNYNTAIGRSALTTLTTNAANTAVGGSALAANTAANNTAVGYASLTANTTGASNVAIGRDALGSNTDASNNTAVGYQAGYNGTTSASNTLIGKQAGYALTTANGNTFIGSDSGDLVTTGQNNTILGRYDGNQGGLDIRTSSNNIVLSDGDGNPRVIVDSSGNVLVGKTSANTSTVGVEALANGEMNATVNGGRVISLDRLGSDGEIIRIRKSSTTVGSIGSEGGDSLYILNGDTGLRFSGGADAILPCTTAGAVRDNAIDLGTGSARFDDIYATNPTIQTSDRNEKQDIDVMSEAETRVAVACKGLIRKFRWIDAVAEKGDDARIHFGIIAQDLQDAFTAEGLDAGRYAMFISSTWWETQTDVPAVEAVEGAEATYDDEGNQLTEAVEAVVAVAEHTVTDHYDTLEEAPEGATERTRLGVRYPELLAFIIGAL
jgi:hypothetical protein